MVEPTDLPIRCRCGHLRGWARRVGPTTVTRVVCHCRFCVAFPRLLGCADEVLDAHGGCEVFQIAPADLELTDGLEHLACLRMSDSAKGAVRWYAACCDTPLVNTLQKPGVPFVAVAPICVDLRDASLETRLGPVRVRVNGRFSRAEARALAATRWALMRMLARYVWMMAGWALRGRLRPNRFFDPATGRPIRMPQVRSLPAAPSGADDDA